MIAVQFEDLTFCKYLHLSSSVSWFLCFLQFPWVSFGFMLDSDFVEEQNRYGEKAELWQYLASGNLFYSHVLLIQK